MKTIKDLPEDLHVVFLSILKSELKYKSTNVSIEQLEHKIITNILKMLNIEKEI